MERWGVIFDWDGVLVDSSRLHEESWLRLGQELGREMPEGFFPKSFGMKNDRVMQELLGWKDDPATLQRLADRKEELFRELVREKGVRVLPGGFELVQALQEEGVPVAVGSSTPRENIDCVLESLGRPVSFSALVTAEDVRHGKPDPEVFLKAAERLGLPPNRCVVVEDAHVGIEAAHRAGMPVLAVATTHPAETLQDADRVVPSLERVRPAMLRELLKT